MNAGEDSIKSECDTLQSKLREAEKDKSKLENDMQSLEAKQSRADDYLRVIDDYEANNPNGNCDLM